MSCLILNLLGEPEVRKADGTAIAIASKKSLALLAYLALAKGQSRPREELVGILWGDRFDQQGRQSLRQAIYAMRKALGPECAAALSLDGEMICLSPALVACDLQRFEDLADRDEEEALREAVDLYRGPVMAGIAIRDDAFEEWIASQRQRYRDLLWRSLYRLAKHQKKRGAYSLALETSQRLIALNPLREKAHRLMMRIHAQSGDRAAALAQYRACEELLRRELKLEPDLTTLRLYEELKSAGGQSGCDAGNRQAAACDAHPFSDTRPAVAVLDFENMGGDSDKDYLARGITSDIVTALSYWRWFPIIGHTSTTPLRKTGAGIEEIAHALDARYVVTGAVRVSGERLRISVQLLDAQTGHHLWANRYDVTLEDLFDIQDEITEKVVASIEPQLLRAERNRAARKRPDDMTAWDYVMRADWCKSELSRERNAEAIGFLEQAIAIDENLSIAWAELAHCHWFEGILGWQPDTASAFIASERAARTAIALDDADWLAHTMLGLCDMWNRRDYDMSLSRLDRALQLNPSASIAHHSAACSLGFAGRPDEALPHIMTVMQIDPGYTNTAALMSDLALTYLQQQKFQDAALYARKAVSLRPDYARAYHRLASALGHLGHADEARKALDTVFRLHPRFDADYVRDTYPFRDKADMEVLLDGLLKAGLGD